MRLLPIGLILVLLLFAPIVANAVKGVVILHKSGCDYFIVNTSNGYAILEWYGGNDPEKGDVMAGDYETYGMKDIYNLTADEETSVWVEDYWLSKSNAINKYYQKCN